MGLLDDYARVSKRKPCEICSGTNWCLVAKDGKSCICPRVESKRIYGDAGFLHVLEGVVYEAPKKRPAKLMQAPLFQDFRVLSQRYRQALGEKQAIDLSDKLGISIDSLIHIGAGWCEESRAFSFPMYNEQQVVVGIRLRKLDGPKFAVSGSKNGLFIPLDLHADSRVFILEGPTDTAAMLDLGFDAIGRPSCSSCVAMTRVWVESRRIDEIVIVSDRDEPKPHPTRGMWTPGQEGTKVLADELKKVASVKVIMPPSGKDARQWLRDGATYEEVIETIDSVETWS